MTEGTDPRYLRANMTEEQRVRARRMEKQRIADREFGRPRQVFDWEFRTMLKKVHAMYDAGMSQQAMSNATGGVLSDKQFSDLLRGKRKTSYRATFNAIMAAEITPSAGEYGARTPVVGSARRLRALRANGWPIKSPILAEMADVPTQALQTISTNNRAYVYRSTHDRIKTLYEKLMDADPLDYGVPVAATRKAKTYAAKSDMIPSLCWDEDTIDDPDAYPEWTGRCGSVQGYLTHLREEIRLKVIVRPHDGRVIRKVLCEPCRTAYHEYKQKNGGGKRGMGELTAAAVREYQEIHPNASASEVAEALDVTARTVVRVRSADRKKKGSAADDVRGDE